MNENLPSVLESIRSYTNQSFCTSNGFKKELIQVDSLDNSITVTTEIDPNIFHIGDYLELIGSSVNYEILLIKSITLPNNFIVENIVVNEILEKGSLAKLVFRWISNSFIQKLLDYSEMTKGMPAVTSEKLGSYSYSLADNEIVSGFPKTLMSEIDDSKRLAGNRRKEYVMYGFV